MALFKFTKAILEMKPIDVYNNGDLSRDFTFVEDIVEGILSIADVIPPKKSDKSLTASCDVPYRIYNIGNSQPIKLLDFISALEQALGQKAIKNILPMQAGDVHTTWADTKDLFSLTGYRPQISIKEGGKNVC